MNKIDKVFTFGGVDFCYNELEKRHYCVVDGEETDITPVYYRHMLTEYHKLILSL